MTETNLAADLPIADASTVPGDKRPPGMPGPVKDAGRIRLGAGYNLLPRR